MSSTSQKDGEPPATNLNCPFCKEELTRLQTTTREVTKEYVWYRVKTKCAYCQEMLDYRLFVQIQGVDPPP